MRVLVATAGPEPARDKADYVVNIAKSLGAELIALHILQEEGQAKGEASLKIFSEAGQKAKVNVITKLEQGDIVTNIVETAEKELAGLIIMGASQGKVVAEWVSSDVMSKIDVPVVVIPHEFKKP